MTDPYYSLTQQARDAVAAPTGFVTFGERFQDFTTPFTGVRASGEVQVTDNVATILLNKNNMRTMRVGVFITAVDPETNTRVGELIFSRRMVRRNVTLEVPLTAKQIPVTFGDLEVAIVSYGPAGLAPRVEAGSEFDGENLPLLSWRTAALNFPQSAFFPQRSGAASTIRGGLNPIMLNRRF